MPFLWVSFTPSSFSIDFNLCQSTATEMSTCSHFLPSLLLTFAESEPVGLAPYLSSGM